MKYLLKLTVVALIAIGSNPFATAQVAIAPCTHIRTYTAAVRGYHFTAPTTFTVCGIYVPDDASTLFQSVSIVRFTAGPPPAFAGTTNNFVTLFQNLNYAPNNMIAVPNIVINAGDIIGVYG